MFDKKENFENRPSCKGYSPCKGYSLSKMVSLGQKLDMPKTCESHFTRTLEFFCAKNRSKNTKYSTNETILKMGHLAKSIVHAKAITFAKWSLWVKNKICQKHAKNHSTRTLHLLCAKNRSKKRQMFEK